MEMDILVADGVASVVKKPVQKMSVPAGSTLYKLRVSANGTTLFKRDIPDEFLRCIPYFRSMIDNKMIETQNRIISIDLDFLTKQGVEQYLSWRAWVYNGCVGAPVPEHDPSAAMFAEYLSDTEYTDPFFAGATIEVSELRPLPVLEPPQDYERFSKYGSPYSSLSSSWIKYEYDIEGKILPYYDTPVRESDHVYTLIIPAGIYCDESGARVRIAQLIKEKFREAIANSDVIEHENGYSIHTIRELVIECSGAIKRRGRGHMFTFEPSFTSRAYSMNIRDDYPRGLPESVASYLAEQYFKTCARGKMNSFRKLALFVSDKPALAKIIWVDNRETVIAMLRVPKKSHNKIKKMEFGEIYAYADSIAKTRETELYIFNDSQLSSIESKMYELETRFNSVKDLYYRLKLTCGDRGFEHVSDTYDLIGGENPIELANKLDILESEWNSRYKTLVANKRKNEPLNRPNVHKYNGYKI